MRCLRIEERLDACVRLLVDVLVASVENDEESIHHLAVGMLAYL